MLTAIKNNVLIKLFSNWNPYLNRAPWFDSQVWIYTLLLFGNSIVCRVNFLDKYRHLSNDCRGILKSTSCPNLFNPKLIGTKINLTSFGCRFLVMVQTDFLQMKKRKKMKPRIMLAPPMIRSINWKNKTDNRCLKSKRKLFSKSLNNV